MQKMVRVRSKTDRNDVREMTQVMFSAVQDKFELAFDDLGDDESNKVMEAIKKKAAKDVVIEPVKEFPVEVMTFETPMTTDQIAILSQGMTLADQYEAIAGKPADKRWKEDRIQKEIEKLNAK